MCALIKSISLPSGFTAEYWRIDTHREDEITKEAVAIFRLYKDEATAKAIGSAPATHLQAILRLHGASFDQWVSKAALAQAKTAGIDVYGQYYAAALAISAADHAPMDASIDCDFNGVREVPLTKPDGSPLLNPDGTSAGTKRVSVPVFAGATAV